MMDTTALKRAIGTSIREAIQIGKGLQSGRLRDAGKEQALATEFAEQLILPAAEALTQEALEEGFNQGKGS